MKGSRPRTDTREAEIEHLMSSKLYLALESAGVDKVLAMEAVEEVAQLQARLALTELMLKAARLNRP